jgi:glycosyltransferase involved in cell wall biosynthesis
MKVLMYGWEFPPQISGGLGTACFGLTQALVAAGHQITFVLPKTGSSGNGKSHVTLVGSDQVQAEATGCMEAEALSRSGFRMEMVNSPLTPYVNSQEYAKLFLYLQQVMREDAEAALHPSRMNISGDYGPNLMAEISRYAAVAGTIAKKVPHQVIHAHDWITIPAGLEARRVSGRPLVVHIHSLEFDRCGDNINQDVYAIERRGMERADRIISVSGFTKSKIVRHYGISPDKITVVHNGVVRKAADVAARVHKRIRDKMVLFLGRITFQKGPDYFVEAAVRVLSVRKDVTFVMVGSGDMMHRMMNRVAELKIGRHFHFPGFLRSADVSRIYAMSDLYIMPSVSEPFGISPLEAMQHDVPVIISRQSGIAEVVGSVFKVDFWDTKALAGKILALLKYNPLRQEMVKNASRELGRINWENAAGRVSDVYGQLATIG